MSSENRMTAYESSQALNVSFQEFFNRLQDPNTDEAKLPRVGFDEQFESKFVMGLARSRGVRNSWTR